MLRLPLAATGVILAALLLYLVLGAMGAERKLAALEPLAPGRADYRITLAFPPERFHQLLLQDQGRLTGVHGNVVDLKDVEPKALRDIARHYWVRAVERGSTP